jgi:hypothetical protein
VTLYLFYIRKVFLEGTPKSLTAFFTVPTATNMYPAFRSIDHREENCQIFSGLKYTYFCYLNLYMFVLQVDQHLYNTRLIMTHYLLAFFFLSACQLLYAQSNKNTGTVPSSAG